MHQYHTEQDIIDVYQRQVDMVFKICYSYMKNIADSEDAVSNTFMKYIQSPKTFDTFEHEKAWFILTATNVCKDLLKQFWRRHQYLDENTVTKLEIFSVDSTLEAVLKLPAKYKTVIYLYYYEGYQTEEIARILHKSPSTVRNQLARARKILKRKLGDMYE